MPEKFNKADLLARKEELELRKLAAEVSKLEDEEQKREVKLQAAVRRDQQMAEDKTLALRDQNACTHRKGGLGVEGYKGSGTDASDYSIQKHTYSHGVTYVHCLRCFKEWKPGDHDYNEALRFPTKNTPSSGAVWSIPTKKEKVS